VRTQTGGPLATPVIFVTFNRPQVTAKVFESIRNARPRQLFWVSDGARSSQDNEEEAVAETQALTSRIDWDCELHTNFSPVNMGCKKRVESGLDWAFQTVDRAIVLEDDCLPHPSFFGFCETLLHHYEQDRRIGVVSGNNFQDGISRSENGYYFSKYPHCWGWATWHRAWRLYDRHLEQWHAFDALGGFSEIADSPQEEAYWRMIFDRQHSNESSSWAYSWVYSLWSQRMLTVLPDKNLVSNIGFGDGATHTVSTTSPLADIPTSPAGNFTHPENVIRNRIADEFTFSRVFQPPSNVTPQKRRRGMHKLWHSIGKRLNRR